MSDERLSRDFTAAELACSHCGELGPWDFQPNIDRLQTLRNHFGKPMVISSGYRCERHPLEAEKAAPGAHTRGAFDVAVHGAEALELTRLALMLTFTGVGWSQKGPIWRRFVHLDADLPRPDAPRPWCWSY